MTPADSMTMTLLTVPRAEILCGSLCGCLQPGRDQAFFYHTTLDWYQESFDKDFKRYLQYLRDSVEILCTNYGEIGGLWF